MAMIDTEGRVTRTVLSTWIVADQRRGNFI